MGEGRGVTEARIIVVDSGQMMGGLTRPRDDPTAYLRVMSVVTLLSVSVRSCSRKLSQRFGWRSV